MDFSQLGDDAQVEGQDFKPDPPEQVAGRWLECDADFLAYHCGYRYETESLEKSIETLRLEIQSLRIMAGAEFIRLHLTMGDKGGRYEIATVKEYQAQRSEKPAGLVERVGALREYMANITDPGVFAHVQTKQEADDSLCQAMYEAHTNGNPELHVLWSLDKDLWMVGGLHMDHKTYEITTYPWNYGACYLDDSGSSKKVKGTGTSFFWHQLLMGDTADNIPGLPKLSADIVMNVMPTAKLVKAEERVRTARGASKQKAARTALQKCYDEVKPKACGPVAAYEYLKKASTDLEAFRLVKAAYVAHYGSIPFTHTHWSGEVSTSTAGDMLLEQARLLWMRRRVNEDVLEFFKEISS
jgi:hypothetical protein